MSWQPAVLEPVRALGRYLVLDARPGTDARAAVGRVGAGLSPERAVIGFGEPLVLALGGRPIPGLRAFPALAGPGVSFPSTQGAVWAYFASDDATELHDRALELCALLGQGFAIREEIAAFRYRGGRDLSDYVDGTASPDGQAGIDAAIVKGHGRGLDGSTFVAVQKWVHDLPELAKLPEAARDRIIGRRHATNEEMVDAPRSAHVKRSEQESFDPPAFMVRRSMPWGTAAEHGLCFVAYGKSVDAYERVLRRMAGIDDGVVDGLMTFSRATSGGYYWCPPVHDGRLDLGALGI